MKFSADSPHLVPRPWSFAGQDGQSGQTCQTPVPLVREEPFSQKPGLWTGCRSHHSTSALKWDPVLLGPKHCPQPGPSGQVQGISRWAQCPTTGQLRERGSFRWPQATGTRPRSPEAVGLTAQEPACQEFGSSGHKTGLLRALQAASSPPPGAGLPCRPGGERAQAMVCGGGGAGRPRVPTGPPEGSRNCKHEALIRWIFFFSVRQRAQPGGP